MRMPRQHKREPVVAEAEAAVNRLLATFDLTYGERQIILAGLLARDAKYVIRMERHGNYDDPGGLE